MILAVTGDDKVYALDVEEVVEGMPVIWYEGDGTERHGVVVSLAGLSDSPPTVGVADDDDPENVIELPIDILELPVSEEPEGDDEDDEDEPEPEEFPGMDSWRIVLDHPDCDSEAAVGVVVVNEDGSDGELDSCHADEETAQAYIDALVAGDDEEPTVEIQFDSDPEPEIAVAEPVEVAEATVHPRHIASAEVKLAVDTSELESALAVAERLTATLSGLSTVAPTLMAPSTTAPAGDTIIVGDVPDVIPAGDTSVEVTLASDTSEPEPVVADEFDIAEVSDDELVNELARRWADRTEAEIEEAIDAMTAEDVAVAAEEPVEEAPAPADDGVEYDWEGVLIVEGLPSGDGRMVAEGALTHRELPIPLMLQTVNAPGHDGSVICGSIHKIERVGQNIMGWGMFDSGDAGQEAKRLLAEGTMRGVSADIDSVIVEFLAEDGTPVSFEDVMMNGVDALEVLVEGRIMGATLTPFPAFQEAHVKVIAADSDDAEALVAAGAVGDVWQVESPVGVWVPGTEDVSALLASAAAVAADDVIDVPVHPPVEWFTAGDMDEPTPFTVFPDGRVYGLIARFGTCHIGFSNKCVPVPKSASKYSHFRNKKTLTAEGDMIATGPIFMDTVHPDLKLVASDAQAHYADTGCAVADVALYENEWGIVAAGSVRPGLTAAQVQRFRQSDVSPDWRRISGRLECVGLLAVNVSGFIVEGLVASGAEVSLARGRYDSVEGEVTALVAAGMVRHAPDVVARRTVMEQFTDRLEQVEDLLERFVVAPERARRAAAAAQALGIDPESKAARRERAAAALSAFGLSVPVETEVFVEDPQDLPVEAVEPVDEPGTPVEEFAADPCGCESVEGSCACTTEGEAG